MKLRHKIRYCLTAAIKAWDLAQHDLPSKTKAEFLDLNIGEGLIQLFSKNQKGTLIDDIAARRNQLRNDGGHILPPVRIRDDLRLSPESFVIHTGETQLISSHVVLERRLALDASFMEAYLNGMGVLEPESNLPGIWVEEGRWQQMLNCKIRLLTPSEVILGHIVRAALKTQLCVAVQGNRFPHFAD